MILMNFNVSSKLWTVCVLHQTAVRDEIFLFCRNESEEISSTQEISCVEMRAIDSSAHPPSLCWGPLQLFRIKETVK